MKTTFLRVIFAALLASPVAYGQTDTRLKFKETATDLVVDTPAFKLQVHKAPYSLTVLAGDKEVLKTDAATGGFFVRNGKTYRLAKVKSWQPLANGLQATVSTTLEGADAEVLFSLFADHIQFTVKTLDNKKNDQVGESFVLATGGHWFGGNITSAHDWPLETGSIVLDPFYASSNQTVPLWLTSSGAGILVPTYELMGFSINRNKDGLFSFNVKNTDRFTCQLAVGRHIVDAFYSMIRLVGKPSQVPPRDYFAKPIFNSWIEYRREVSQKDVEEFVQKIRDCDFPCAVVEIDDQWTQAHGDFTFDAKKFPDPKGMVDRLHALGLKVILWGTPFFEEASPNYKIGNQNRYFIMDGEGKAPYIANWWDGKAALVDLSNPRAYDWFAGLLQNLSTQYGIDGYKLDAGDAEFLTKPFTSFGRISSSKYTDLYAGIGRYFDINELRVSWLVQDLGLVQRLRDKDPTWSRVDGLKSLIPHGLAEGLVGYQFWCPDMIGGGLEGGFTGPNAKVLDPEIFIRWTEASALMPMMQFSYGPWRMGQKTLDICRKYSKLHEQLGDYIYSLAIKATQDGTPITRPLFFRNPEDARTYSISDQFMLGDRFLVAPVMEKGAVARDVYLPQGTWTDFWSGQVYSGGQTLKNYPAPLDTLPIFINVL